MILKAADLIPKHFGIYPQWVDQDSKLEEEIGELQEAIYDYENVKTEHNLNGLIDELADLIFLLIQVIVYYKLSPFAIYKRILYKAKRTLARIKSDYYREAKK